MFKLVVLFSLVAVSMAAPAPGLLHGSVAYAIPTAVSHQSRVDVHNAPVLATTYSVAAPVAHVAAPFVSHVEPVYHALPAAVSHSSRVDLHRTALIAAPVLGHGYGYGLGYSAAVPAIHGW